jgi:hypothetical protein
MDSALSPFVTYFLHPITLLPFANAVAACLAMRYVTLDGSLRGSKGNTVQAERPMPWLPPQL